MNFNEENRSMPDLFALEAFYPQAPELNAAAWQQHLQAQLGTVDIVSANPSLILLALRDFCVDYEDAQGVPAQITIMLPDKQGFDLADYQAQLQQSWDWQDAADTLAQCRYTVAITELFARGLSIAERATVFRAVINTLIELTQPAAFCPAQVGCFFNPQTWQAHQQNGHWHYGFINVRFFNIENSDDGAILMDSQGAGVFGVPDVQCHFKGELDPNEVAHFLFNTAIYLMEQGDVIEDGHTIGEDYWSCRHEDALIAPERLVLDIRPNEFAAGSYHD